MRGGKYFGILALRKLYKIGSWVSSKGFGVITQALIGIRGDELFICDLYTFFFFWKQSLHSLCILIFLFFLNLKIERKNKFGIMFSFFRWLLVMSGLFLSSIGLYSGD